MTDGSTLEERLRRGRAAAKRRAWHEAHVTLSEVDGEQELGPEDLELLAKASWWIGRAQGSIDARERAYASYADRGDRARAALMALTLRREYSGKLASSVAAGWLSCAERLLGDGSESPAHGYLALAHGELARSREEFDHAFEHFDRAAEIASRLDDPDLPVWAAMRRADALLATGRMDEGWRLMEEAGTAAAGGKLGAYTTGAVFCNVMIVCCETADYRRASEWSDVAKRWCERQDIAGFPGVCRVHRAEIMRLLGSWEEAEREAQDACDELREFHPAIAGDAFRELGEVRLRMGDHAGAEEAFREAQELGADPHPGLALLLLARGNARAAAAGIRGSLEESSDRLRRARLLPAQATIALELGDRAVAIASAEEQAAIAKEYGTAAIEAGAEWAAAVVALLGGDPEAVRSHLRRARRLWRDVDAPYEAAITSVMLAESLSADDQEAARLELQAARATFDRLGARPDAERAAALLKRMDRPPSGRAVRTFLFTDIVGSTALIEAMGDEAWANMRRWHDEALRACFGDNGGREVDHAGDGFFVSFPDAASALACATGIQLGLAEHRRDHGFAPAVRIGLHAAEATVEGEGYSGRGVHTAARIASLAAAGEILASEETLDGIGDLEVSSRREVELAGLSGPVGVVSISWRSG